MKRKTVGGVIPDNIPAAQRARTEAAIQVGQGKSRRTGVKTVLPCCSTLGVTSCIATAPCSWWPCRCRHSVLTGVMVCCAQAGKVTVTAPNPLFISVDAASRKAR
jgi:hypothetical protein